MKDGFKAKVETLSRRSNFVAAIAKIETLSPSCLTCVTKPLW